MKKTDRGFRVYVTLRDTYRATVRVQESSSVHRRVWIFCENAPVIHPTTPTAPHLTPGMARRIAKALLVFADDRRPT